MAGECQDKLKIRFIMRLGYCIFPGYNFKQKKNAAIN